jgi:hypothetical protein
MLHQPTQWKKKKKEIKEMFCRPSMAVWTEQPITSQK